MPEKEKHISEGNNLCWYVMKHKDPRRIEQLLQRENVCQEREGQPLYEYFIPFRFLTHISQETDAAGNGGWGKDIENANALRYDLHDFVFIKTTALGISSLLMKEWNRTARIRLWYYRDFQGRNVTISEEEMSALMTVFCEKRVKFSFGLPLTDISANDTVVIRTGMFKGQSAYIVDVLHTDDGVSLTLGINIFAETKSLRLPGYKETDISLNRTAHEIIGTRFVDDIENSLLDIYGRKVCHKETDDTKKQDVAELNRIFHYSYVTVRNVEVNSRFMALMLICAALRNDIQARNALATKVKNILGEADPTKPYIQAYLLLALYISTNKAEYRTSSKHYMRQQANIPAPFRRFMSLAKRVKGRK